MYPVWKFIFLYLSIKKIYGVIVSVPFVRTKIDSNGEVLYCTLRYTRDVGRIEDK